MGHFNILTTTSRTGHLPLYEILYLYQVALYGYIIGVVLCLWDWLLTLGDEFRMVENTKKARGVLLDSVYYTSRVSSLILLAISFSVTSGAPAHCKTQILVLDIAQTFWTTSNSSLFLFRAVAVFADFKWVRSFFIFGWLAVVGCTIGNSVVFDKSVTVDPETHLCNFGVTYTVFGLAADIAFDTLVYLAISWRMACLTVKGNTMKARARAFVSGDGLLNLSKCLLRGGQVYYFTTVGLKLSMGIIFNDAQAPSLVATLIVPYNVALTSIMACRVYRDLKLGAEDPTSSTAHSTMVFAHKSQVQGGMSFSHSDE